MAPNTRDSHTTMDAITVNSSQAEGSPKHHVPIPPQNPTTRFEFKPCLLLVILVTALPGFLDNVNMSVVNNSRTGVVSWFAQNGVEVTRDMWSTYASLQQVGAIIGSLLTGFLVKKMGPRNGMIMNDAVYLVAAIITCACGSNFGLFCFGKFLMGMAMGITMPTGMMLVGECAPSHQRGTAMMLLVFLWMSGMPTAFTLGMQSVMGNPEWWRVLYTMFSTLAVVHAVVAWFIPESPWYLMMVGKIEPARRSLVSLRAVDDVREEMVAMKEAVEHESKPHYIQGLKALLCSTTYIQPLMIGLLLPLMSQFSGGMAINMFSKSLLVSLNMGNAETATIMIGCLALPTVAALGYSIDMFGRKTILIYNWAAATVAAVCFGFATVFRTGASDFVGVISILVFIVTNIPAAAINMMLSTELFPGSVRPVAVSLCSVFAGLATFGSVKSFLYMMDAFGEYLFFFYAGVTSLGVIFVIFFVPETAGMDLDKAHELFSQSSGRRISSCSATSRVDLVPGGGKDGSSLQKATVSSCKVAPAVV